MILKIHGVPILVKLNETGSDEDKFGKRIEFEGDNFDDGLIEPSNEEFVGNGIAKDLHEILDENKRGT